MVGGDLLNTLIQSSGLPESFVKNQLYDLIYKAGYAPETITLDQIREVLGGFLQDLILANEKGLE